MSDDVFWTDKFSVADIYNGTHWNVEGVLDRSVLELFVDRGVHAATMLYYPESPLTVLSVASNDLSEEAEVEVKVWGLESAWGAKKGSDGVVRGNVTTMS
jgi:beta-fructofuranosidase